MLPQTSTTLLSSSHSQQVSSIPSTEKRRTCREKKKIQFSPPTLTTHVCPQLPWPAPYFWTFEVPWLLSSHSSLIPLPHSHFHSITKCCSFYLPDIFANPHTLVYLHGYQLGSYKPDCVTLPLKSLQRLPTTLQIKEVLHLFTRPPSAQMPTIQALSVCLTSSLSLCFLYAVL